MISTMTGINSQHLKTLCVGRMLPYRSFLNWVTQSSFRLSPFGDVPRNIAGEPLFKVAQHFFEQVGELSWIKARKRNKRTDQPAVPKAQ
jgi:hypothetical protein